MTENWKYEASVKTGDVMHNVRGDDAAEFEKNLLEFPVGARCRRVPRPSWPVAGPA